MKIFEKIINYRERLNLIEKRLSRQSLEIYELRRELAKMSTEIARLKTGHKQDRRK